MPPYSGMSLKYNIYNCTKLLINNLNRIFKKQVIENILNIIRSNFFRILFNLKLEYFRTVLFFDKQKCQNLSFVISGAPSPKHSIEDKSSICDIIYFMVESNFGRIDTIFFDCYS